MSAGGERLVSSLPGWKPSPRPRPGKLACVLLAAAVTWGCAAQSPPATPGGALAAASAAEGAGTHQLLVLLRKGPLWQRQGGELGAEYGLRQSAAWTVGSLDGTPCVIYETVADRPLAGLLRRLGADPRVDVAQPLQRFRVLQAPPGAYNDPYVKLQRWVEEQSLAAVHRTATGRGVRVGVVDTGLDLDHPDLRGRIAGAGNFVERGETSFTSDVHGTAVAGILVAAANNQVGIVGVAPGAQLFAFKACWQEPAGSRQAVCDSYTLGRAIDAALAADVQVLNLSLTGPPDPFLSRLVMAALARGVVVVAAWDGAIAGGGFPASMAGVVAVGAEAQGGETGSAAPPLSGPAVDVLSTAPRGTYDFFQGSSFAAAHAAGVAALLLELFPTLAPAEVRDILISSASGDAGSQRLDPCAALARATGRAVCG